MNLKVIDLENSIVIEVDDQTYRDHQLELEAIDTICQFKDSYSLILGKLVPRKATSIDVYYSNITQEFESKNKHLYFSKIKRLGK